MNTKYARKGTPAPTKRSAAVLAWEHEQGINNVTSDGTLLDSDSVYVRGDIDNEY